MIKALTLVFFILMQGCSAIKDDTLGDDTTRITALTPSESEQLNQLLISHHFLPGCVTELISDLSDLPCQNLGEDCLSDFDKTLSYDQWLGIYQACIVK